MKNEKKSHSLPNVNHDEDWNTIWHSRYSSFETPLNPELSDENPSLLFGNCFVDHSGRQFACIHGHCNEQPTCFKNNLLQEKIDFYELRFHQEDRMLWCDKVFPDILKFIGSEPNVEPSDYRFIFNHRYIRKDGSISQFMHEGSLNFVDDKCLPVLNLKVFFEIADIKADETIILTIFRYSAEHGYRKVFSKMYSDTSNSILSLRELEIIKLCHQGLSSKMIADKLNLSIHTVKNHKRNCMEKTLTHNISELIHACIKNHWL